MSDPGQTSAAHFALNCDICEAVHAMVAVVAHGGAGNDSVQDIDRYMYGRSFSYPDGNVFEPFWMNPEATPA